MASAVAAIWKPALSASAIPAQVRASIKDPLAMARPLCAEHARPPLTEQDSLPLRSEHTRARCASRGLQGLGKEPRPETLTQRRGGANGIAEPAPRSR
eukprot:143388-Alexandrium_andersonii.AAC.1